VDKKNNIENLSHRNKNVQDVSNSKIDLSEKHSIRDSRNVAYNNDIKAHLVHIGDKYEIRYENGSVDLVPSVLEFLALKITKDQDKRNYQDYLNATILPYCARTAYKDQHLKEDSLFVTETDILQALDQQLGCIIMGRGGIGKTRTMYEVGKMAEESGWSTLVLPSNFVAVKFLLSNLNKEQKYLLVFDYIEESESFGAVVEYIVEHRREGQLKILANCRRSFYENLKSLLYTSKHLFHIADFANPNAQDDEAAYQNWVVKEIIRPFRKKIKFKANKNKTFFRLRSSFAVFLRYLLDKGATNLNLHQFDTFEAWLIRRLELTLNNAPTAQRIDLNTVAQQLLLLPVFDEQVDDYLTNFELHEKLITDGWLQETEYFGRERLDTVHDTVKDELLLNLLRPKNETERQLRRQVTSSLQFAYQHNGLKNWFRAYERIMDEPIFEPYPNFFFEFFKKKLSREQYPEFNAYYLTKSALLSEEQKFDLIVKKEAFFADFVLSSNFGLPLAYALNFFSKEENQHNTPPRLQHLAQNWITANQGFVDVPFLADRMLSTYLKKYGQDAHIQPYLHQFIQKQNPISGNYTIRVWLDQGGTTATIEAFLLEYLQANAADKEARFVLGAWLKQGGERATIEAFLLKYLQANAADKEASFVLGEWLKQGGATATATIEVFLLKYLQANAADKEASFVLGEWLKQGGATATIKDYVDLYLQANAADKDAQFVLAAWLKQGGEIAFIKDYVDLYLEANAADKEASFVLGEWLKQGGATATIKDYVDLYLQANAADKEASFVLGAWLNQGGAIAFIKDYIDLYLEANAADKEAQFVLAAWLKQGGAIAFIKDYVYDYLKKHAALKSSSFVYQAYLKKAKKDKDNLKPYLNKWLAQYATDKNTKFLLILWLTQTKDNPYIQPYLQQWLDKHPNDNFASLLVEQWIENGGHHHDL
jgi:hypothetical protein